MPQSLANRPTLTPSEPLVSVIIPVRNCREYIHECLDSITSQSHLALEIIVVDDGSTDFDYASLATLDARIRVLRLEGQGVSVARNTGMQAASGEFITFLDADDVWCPGKVQAQVAYLRQHPQVGCVFGRFRRWELNEQGAFPVAASLMEDVSACSRCEPDRSGWLYTRLLDGLLVGMNTAMIRREVLDKLGGFDETMRIGEDYLFWLKVSRMFEMHSLDAMVALYRIHPASAMRRLDPANHQHDILSVAVARWGLANPDGSVMTPAAFTRRLSECAFTHAYNHFWGGASHVARRWFWVALRGGFLPAKCLVYLALSPVSPWLRRVWG